MAQYIDKDAVDTVLRKLWKKDNGVSNVARYAYNGALQDIQCEIDALEMKEVDSLTPEEIKKICTIYDNLNQERKCATVLYNSDETFFNHVLMVYKSIAQKGE